MDKDHLRPEAPRLSRTISDGLSKLDAWKSKDADGGTSSDDDLNRPMEVVFESDNAKRRKSSIVLAAADAPRVLVADGLSSGPDATAKRPTGGDRKQSCLVHQLVEKASLGQQPKVENKLAQIDEVPAAASNKSVNGDAKSSGSSPRVDETRVTHSRLLTKKQLSDMAVSVRNLAKKLGALNVKFKIRSVFLLTKAHDPTLIRNTRDVSKWLLSKDRDVPYIVYVEDTMKENSAFDAEGLLQEGEANGENWSERLRYWNNELARKHPHTFDFVVTLGGDGTVLYASWLFQRVVPPVLSFALGSLGFLTKFDYNDYQSTLEQAFRDGVTISLRLRFEGTVMRSQRSPGEDLRNFDLVQEILEDEIEGNHTHKPDKTYEILNDIVVDRGPNPTMSTIELFGDEEHLTTVQADGICVATPTGSTAYNLAAGGSLCHPENPVILVTAICAHTLSFRPIVLPDTIVLRLGVPYDARANSWASFDGRERIELKAGDYVTISASRYPFANVMPPGRRSEDWVNSISRTLQWNSRQRQKAFQEFEQDKGSKRAREESQKEGEEDETRSEKKGKKHEEEAELKRDNSRADMKRGGEGHGGVQ